MKIDISIFEKKLNLNFLICILNSINLTKHRYLSLKIVIPIVKQFI